MILQNTQDSIKTVEDAEAFYKYFKDKVGEGNGLLNSAMQNILKNIETSIKTVDDYATLSEEMLSML